MDQRIVEFIRTLRAVGIRISVAESNDAMRAAEQITLNERGEFRSALKTTLVKEGDDGEKFEHFFPIFFDTAAPPMFDMEQELSPEQQQTLQNALQSLMGDQRAIQQMLQQLMQQMMSGQAFSRDQLEQLAQQMGMQNAANADDQGYYESQMMRALGMRQLQKMMDQLREQLEGMGMSQEDIDQIMEMMEQNRQGLARQIQQFVGQGIAEQVTERYETEPDEPRRDIMNTPFQYLSESEVEQIRDEMKRLAAKLRSRAALRQKRDKSGNPDPKSTIRGNLKYGGTPIELHYRDRHQKPKLVAICDVSTSMRYCAEFMLTLLYELQDQVSKTRSFIFIDDLVEISHYFKEKRPEIAVQQVLNDNPPGHYNTDLGNSLKTLFDDKLDSVDPRTTVIMLGDGRNNYRDPRLDLANDLNRRSRRVIWFNPEPEHEWGSGDSDMHRYAPVSSGVYQVRNLAQLVEAIDRIMTD